MRALAVVLALAPTLGCNGFGNPIVGPVALGMDMGRPDSGCAVPPACDSLEPVPEEVFALPDDRRPVPLAGEDGCEPTEDCERLAAGDPDLRSALLRGCRTPSPVRFPDGVSLRGALVDCSAIELDVDGAVDLADASVVGSVLTVRGAPGSTVELRDRALVRDAWLELEAPVQLRVLDGAVTDRSTVRLRSTFGVPEQPAALFRRTEQVGLVLAAEGPRSRIRVDDTRLFGGLVRADVIELIDAGAFEATLDARDLYVIGSQVQNDVILRAPFAAIGASTLSDVRFAGCDLLSLSEVAFRDLFVPACPPGNLRLTDVVGLGGRIEGGFDAVGGGLAEVALGGPRGRVRYVGTDLASVNLCPVDRGELRTITGSCLQCDDRDDLPYCLEGSSLTANRCPTLVDAPACQLD
ncbi:MAG: hypothetical protein ACFCGT_28280 [Sandaracinaceae bacterium]